MFSYTVFIVRFGFAVNPEEPPVGYNFIWIIFLLAHVVCSIALHTITLYLSVATAFIRYKTLKQIGSLWNHENIAFPVFLLVAAFTIILCIPTFLIHSIIPVVTKNVKNGENITLYTVGLAEFKRLDTCFFFKLNLWMTGIIFKLILLTVFFSTEFPQGILAILNGLFPNDIHQFVYLSLGELLDLLSLINCNTCFIVYPLISSQYRSTLKSLIECIRQLIAGKGWKASTFNIRSRSRLSEAKLSLASRPMTPSPPFRFSSSNTFSTTLSPFNWPFSRKSTLHKSSITLLHNNNINNGISGCSTESTQIRFLDDQDVLL
uniref:Serpentine receptor class gamma n=1 Tax=Meloidogyne javanica TaxID=6303 RepID=A0A915M8B3_MELJA